MNVGLIFYCNFFVLGFELEEVIVISIGDDIGGDEEFVRKL